MTTNPYDNTPSSALDIENDKDRAEWYRRFNAGTLNDYEPEPEPQAPPAPSLESDRDPHAVATDDQLVSDLQAAIEARIFDPTEEPEPEPQPVEVIGPVDTNDYVFLRDTDKVEMSNTYGWRGEKHPLWRELFLKRGRAFIPNKKPRELSHHAKAFQRRTRKYGNPDGLRLTMAQARFNGQWGTVMQVEGPDDKDD